VVHYADRAGRKGIPGDDEDKFHLSTDTVHAYARAQVSTSGCVRAVSGGRDRRLAKKMKVKGATVEAPVTPPAADAQIHRRWTTMLK
jgi:hypothetical protein